MDINAFIKNVADQFEETDIEFTPETKFRELTEWSSLMALSVIAMVDDEYGVVIKGDDLRSVVTIQDLFQIVKSRKS